MRFQRREAASPLPCKGYEASQVLIPVFVFSYREDLDFFEVSALTAMAEPIGYVIIFQVKQGKYRCRFNR